MSETPEAEGQPGQPEHPAEVEYLTRQGGFSVSTFSYLFQIVREYREQRNLAIGEAIVEVRLATGETIPIGGVRAAFGWVLLLAEDDSMRFVPYRNILDIAVSRRPGQPPAPTARQPTGFTYEPINEEQPG